MKNIELDDEELFELYRTLVYTVDDLTNNRKEFKDKYQKNPSTATFAYYKSKFALMNTRIRRLNLIITKIKDSNRLNKFNPFRNNDNDRINIEYKGDCVKLYTKKIDVLRFLKKYPKTKT